MCTQNIKVCLKYLSRSILGISLVAGLIACDRTKIMGEKQTYPLSDLSEMTSKITNGNQVPNDSPESLATVALYLAEENTVDGLRVTNFCTGTLIRKNLVLTAAHCLVDFADSLRIDANSLQKNILIGFGKGIHAQITPNSTSLFRKILNFKVHPQYKSNSVTKINVSPMYDIAMLELDQNAPNDAQIATPATSDLALERGQYIRLVGFGVVDGVSDKRATQMMEVDVQIENPYFSPTQFTYSVVNGKASCHGDSGGPAYYYTGSGRLMLLGITSWGDQDCKHIGALTNVPYFADWIQKTIGFFHQSVRF